MKQKEKDFCRLTAVLGDPGKAAERAGFKDPEKAWPELVVREDIAEEIHRASSVVGRIYKDTLLCGIHRMMTADNSDVIKLVCRDRVGGEEFKERDISGVSEIKRTDKGIELKFFDRIKLLEKLNGFGFATEENTGGGLIEAMRLSARALLSSCEGNEDTDGV